MVAAVTAITAVTLGIAFAVVAVLETRSQEQHLDRALARAAHEEAESIARFDPATLAIGDRRPLTVNDAGPLEPYVALFAPDGESRSLTPGVAAAQPDPTLRRHRTGDCFDFALGGAPFRGLLSEIPGQPGRQMLFAVSRADLDGDRVFLRRAMEVVFLVAVAWTVVVATWIVRRLTRNQRRIAEVVRRVAAGDLSARVGSLGEDGDEVRLARDVDDMVGRLAELLSAQRVFIAHAAHELRSPLTALYGELALALRRSRDADAYRDAIRSALESTKELTGLAEDLLAVARLGTAPPPVTEPVDVRDAIEEAAQVVLPAELQAGVRLDVEAAPAAPSALAWRRDLVRLFRNLLENAVRHSPPGGAVRVTVAGEGDKLVVEIADQGAGVPAADRERIFAPFYRGTTVPVGSGVEVGLGLTIARGIARAYGGDVVLDADRAEGACFRVTLRAASAAEAPAIERSTA
jgi:two-component system heavy metal sensor histidine kinase CusS